MRMTESEVEEAALAWFAGLGYDVRSGPVIAPGEPKAERSSFSEVVLPDRLRGALDRLNPTLPDDAIEAAFAKITNPAHASLIANNREFHRFLTEGVPVEYRDRDGRVVHASARLADFKEPDANDFCVVNQFAVVEGKRERRPDIVAFVNGLPLGVIELKNIADEDATIWDAFRQLQTYKEQIPTLFAYNGVLVISDGIEARVGSLSADRERFMPWRTVEGNETASDAELRLEVLVKGVFEKRRFLDYLRHFVAFEDDGVHVVKKIAGYHQYHAVNHAVAQTLQAAGQKGDRRGGVIGHTQGSGKSLTMLFYAGKVIVEPFLQNPTLVVLTDRNDLDDQLFGTFARCSHVLRQAPVQAKDRADLRHLLAVASGGVVFTTIQKFLPEARGDRNPALSDRRNIVVIADEAHRSQYDFIDGYARHLRDALPKATFLGFTGTPLERDDRDTRHVFGEYVSVYDIQQAVEDGATVPI